MVWFTLLCSLLNSSRGLYPVRLVDLSHSAVYILEYLVLLFSNDSFIAPPWIPLCLSPRTGIELTITMRQNERRNTIYTTTSLIDMPNFTQDLVKAGFEFISPCVDYRADPVSCYKISRY